MVYVVSGKLGSGKSFYMCDCAVSHMLRGGVVATNMKLDPQRISQEFKRHLLPWQFRAVDATSDPRQIPSGDLRGRGSRRVMVILDEALNWFASQGGAKDDRKATWGEWLRQSDKLGQDVYFIAQNFERAAKWIRELAQIAIQITAVRHLTFMRIPFGKIPGLRSLYGVTWYDVASQKVLTWHLKYYDKRLYGCYSTSELFGFEASANGYIGNVARPFRVPFFPFLVPVAFLILAGVYYARSVS